MAKVLVKLQTFKAEELIYDEEETREILIYFFPNDKAAIEVAIINDEIRSFAQAILIEAVDKSYAMGWIDIISSLIGNLRSPKALIRSWRTKLQGIDLNIRQSMICLRRRFMGRCAIELELLLETI